MKKTYKKLLGKSKAARCISPGMSRLSQKILASVVFLSSVSWAPVKRTDASSFSYLKVFKIFIVNRKIRTENLESQSLRQADNLSLLPFFAFTILPQVQLTRNDRISSTV